MFRLSSNICELRAEDSVMTLEKLSAGWKAVFVLYLTVSFSTHVANANVNCDTDGECAHRELVCDSTENLVHICSGVHSCAGATLRLHRADCRLLCSAEHSCENASVVYESGASALEVLCDATSACASLSVSQTRHSHTLQMDCAAADACGMALTLYSSDNCVRCLQTADACNGLALICEFNAQCNVTSFVSNSLQPTLSCADDAVCVCGGPQPIKCKGDDGNSGRIKHWQVSLISAASGVFVFLLLLFGLWYAKERYKKQHEEECIRIRRTVSERTLQLEKKRASLRLASNSYAMGDIQDIELESAPEPLPPITEA